MTGKKGGERRMEDKGKQRGESRMEDERKAEKRRQNGG
jgi:hypothetical protein